MRWRQRMWCVCLLGSLLAWRTAAAPVTPPIDRAALAASVRAEFVHAWSNYEKFASGHDELNPISKTPHDWYPPAIVYMTPVDALDTMRLMGLKADADRTSALIASNLRFDKDVSVQVFEITIRELGALLTEFQTTHDKRFLALAEDLGTRLLPAFKSPTGMPYRFVNLKTGVTRDPISNPAEVGTLMLEFGALAKLTGKPVFYDTAKKAVTVLYAHRSPQTGLVGENINVDTAEWTSPKSHVGGGIDSYYEYLVKSDRLFGDKDFARMASESLAAINKYVADDGPNGLWYGEVDMNTGKRTATTYGALHAFLPTLFVMTGDIDRAKRLQDSGFKMWTRYGIEPEEFDYSTMNGTSFGYQLRPEIVESAYYLFHATHDEKYLAMGQRFLDDLIRDCRVENGYTTLRSVVTKQQGDRMHSFLLAETFKYLYLLFAPETTLDFDAVTFNTEAHPLRHTW